MSASVVNESFPLWALLPKRETTAQSFIDKYPEYDGRGIKIAILDSGVDPGADGLQTTSDGKPKIIDMMDATGAGDVDTSTVVEADGQGFITGLTGTKLKIPGHWVNPSGKYHIGMKNMYELYPEGVGTRMAREYRETHLVPTHTTIKAEAVRELQEFEDKHPNASNDTFDEKLIREDLKSKMDFLKEMETNSMIGFKDLGPTCDCVVFSDGSHWMAVIHTSGTGSLEDCTLLGNYRECLTYGTISDRGASHGTHVASIAAANFPNDPDRNGVAPGAQIVSICMFGIRYNGSSLVRALNKVIETGCHVINMSYDMSRHYFDGCFVNLVYVSPVLDLMSKVVNKYGILCVKSAGNYGPSLSTVGMIRTVHSQSFISVGAYVSPDMMTTAYSLNKQIPGLMYHWTSRGPTLTGDLGVTVCAPGGAITSVPTCELMGAELMSGTSMSAPNCAGCLCLLLSGVKALNVEYSLYSVRRAIENTALKIENYEPLTHGHGLIQVEKAFEHLIHYKDSLEMDVRFHITCGQGLGVYLREAIDVINPSLHIIKVEPIFLNHKQMDNKRKVDFEINLRLICDDEWITCAEFLHMTYTTREVTIRVDPQPLQEGCANFAMIKAYDINCVEKGPIYKPGYFWRQFIDIPANVTQMVVRVKNCEPMDEIDCFLQALQVRPLNSLQINKMDKSFSLRAQNETTFAFHLKTSRTLEVCFGQTYEVLADNRIQLDIKFHGLQPSLDSFTMFSSEMIARIDIQSNFDVEEITPRITIRNFIQMLMPIDSKLRPLDSRDVIPPAQQLYEGQDVKISSLSLLYGYDLTYGPEYISLVWMIFNSDTKQYIGTGLGLPSSIRLEKGDYIIKVQIKHTMSSQWERLCQLPFHIQYTVNKSLDLYDTYRNALTDSTRRIFRLPLRPDTPTSVFIRALVSYPPDIPITNGSYFTGRMEFADGITRFMAEDFQFKYVVDSQPIVKSASSATKVDENESKIPSEDQFSTAVSDLKISWVSKLKGKASEDLFNELRETDKTNVRLLLARIQALDSDSQRSQHLSRQICLAND
ncbi:unnamed protein product, partial [Oppiella nova]